MEIDPTNPYEDGDGNPLLGDQDLTRPPDPSWGDVVGGIWGWLTTPLPRTA